MPATLAVLDFVPVLPYVPRWRDPAVVAEFEGSPLTARASTLERAFRVFPVHRRMTAAAFATFVAFWEARRGVVSLFYWKDPLGYTRVAVPLGVSAGGQVDFPIPDGSPYGGDFPIADANAILKSDGTPIAKTTDTDGRKFTASAAPGAGHTMTADYWYYRRVRFGSDELGLNHPAVGTYEVAVDLLEEAP